MKKQYKYGQKCTFITRHGELITGHVVIIGINTITLMFYDNYGGAALRDFYV